MVFLFLACFSTARLGYRSQLFTILGISFIYWKLTQKTFSPLNIVILPILFAFWANLHGGFVLGLTLLLIFSIDCLLTCKKKEALIAALTLMISFLAGLINPFGIALYRETYRHSWYPLNKLIAEWVPPNNAGMLLIFITISIIATTLIYQTINGKLIKIEKVIFLIFSWILFTILSFTARRHLPLFAISSIYLFNRISDLKISKTFELHLKRIITVGLLGIIAYRIFNLPNFEGGWKSLCYNQNPSFLCQAENFLITNPEVCQKVFNTYEWGGHISWRLPNRKTFIDGRMPTWPTPEGKSPYTIWLEIIQAREGFEKELDRYGADCLFISKGTFLDLELRKNKLYPWKIIHESGTVIIYQKTNDKN